MAKFTKNNQPANRGRKPGSLNKTTKLLMEATPEILSKVIEAAIRRAPVLEKAEVLRGWGGLYTITPDDNPIIGEVPGVHGLFSAVGFSGHGFQQAPEVGHILSQLILDGKTNFDLKPFAYDRFGKKEQKGEKRVV